ncbi:MAG: Fe-S cluster assembly protein SufD [Candidatus Omnitrophica bacterium]|nr:Fe-S cluster assembly protein SufD [Candidatus Omnitrophota bacterium]
MVNKMTPTLARSTPFIQSLKVGRANALPGEPLWLTDLRKSDALFMDACELPQFGVEEWKHTSLASLWSQSARIADAFNWVVSDELKALSVKGARTIFIVNGQPVKDGSWLSAEDLPGVAFLSGTQAWEELDAGKRNFNAVSRNDSGLFLRLNRLGFKEPLVITVEPDTVVGGLLHIVNLVTVPDAALFPRIFIRLGRGAELNVLQSYVSWSGGGYVNVPVTDVILEAGARLEYAESHEQSLLASYIGAVRVWQGRDSSFRSMVATSGAGLFRSNISVMLEGEGAGARINGLHRLNGEAHADSHTLLEHLALNTTSDQMYKCVLEDSAHSVFNGRVFVHREAQKTSSYQLNKNLLLSRDCRVDTKPQLEIKADDVKCTHGATISQLNDEQLFYLQTRGIGREASRLMLVQGFMDDVLSRVAHPLIRQFLTRALVPGENRA